MRLRLLIAPAYFICSPVFLHSQSNVDQLIDAKREIKSRSYEVTETIHSPFGSTKIIYTVSNKSMINTNDLGPNNTREIKEIIAYKKSKKATNLESKSSVIEVKKEVVVVDKENDSLRSILIDPLETYERMVDKGIKSVEILIILGDSYFYKNNFVKAASYYEQLFKLTKDLKQKYYVRYSESLTSSGQTAKAKEFNKKYKVLLSK